MKLYFFGEGISDGDMSLKHLLGSKGASLAELARLKIPLPFGFTIPTECCRRFFENDENFEEGWEKSIKEGLIWMEEQTQTRLNDPQNPLLLSVRSGASVSMPGMMDSILNLGMNEKVC